MPLRSAILKIFWGIAVLVLSGLPALAAERVALLIGNSAYARPEMALPNPVNDVAALGASLRDLGFRVTEVTDQDADGMARAVELFADQAQGADIALFFYAGHGVQIGGQNHLVGTDFGGSDLETLRRTSITMDRARRAIESGQPKLGMLILDACRNNPFSEAGMVEQGLVRQSGGAGILVAYATDPGNVAYDGAGENSVFTTALLRHLPTPGLDARLMLGRVRQQVVLETRGQQVPWVEEAVLGEHYLGPALPEEAGDDPVAAEIARWRGIAGSGDRKAFAAYLADYPQGLFRDIAEERITALDRPAASGAAPVTTLMASADIEQVSSALVALGLMSPQRDLSRALPDEVVPALEGYRQQLADPSALSADQLFTDATRVSMVLAATTLQRIRTDIVALRGVENTLKIASDALAQIAEIAEADASAEPVLQSARNDVEAIRLARAQILRRLDQSRSYYDEILTRAALFVPEDASVALIGAGDRSRDLAQGDRQLTRDAEMFLKHVSQTEEARKGSYAWLTDLLPEE